MLFKNLFLLAILALISVVSAVPVASSIVKSAKYDNNGRMINAAGQRIRLEYADRNRTIVNAFGQTYNATDIMSVEYFMAQPDTPEVADKFYFEFNEANIAASGQQAFYAVWTMEAQKEYANFTQVGEWNLFNDVFLENRNFMCSWDTQGCHNMASLHLIKKMYPSRPQARLVYFTLMEMRMYHDLSHAMEHEFSEAQASLLGEIHKLIQDFTRQPVPSRLEACRILKQLLQTAADVAMNLAFTAFRGIPMPSFEIVFSMDPEIIKEAAWKHSHKGFKNSKFEAWTGSFETYTSSIAKLGGAAPKAKAISFNPLQELSFSFPMWISQTFTENIAKTSTTLNLKQGYSKDLICGGFRGDETDRSSENVKQLTNHITTNFKRVRRGLRDTFYDVTKGVILEEGSPSVYAMVVMNNKWAGQESIRSRLEHMQPVKDNLEIAVVKDVVSSVLAGDGNYVSCGKDMNAQQLCKDAREGRALAAKGADLKLASGKVLNLATISYVCPNKYDRNLICQPQRQIPGKYYTQVVEYAGLQTLGTYTGLGFNTTFEEAIIEGYQNYLLFGNNITAFYGNFGTGDVSGVGLRMGFCVNDKILMKDFGGHVLPHEASSRQWEVPACCGDKCNKTQEFLRTIGQEINGPFASQREDGEKAPQLYRDRMPRVLERFGPGLRYLGWGNAGIHFPDHTLPAHPMPHNRYKFDVGVDKDFELITEATKSMTSDFEVSLWFCRDGSARHTVFDRERKHVHLAASPAKVIKNSRTVCKAWLKENAVAIGVWDANA